MRLPSRCEDTLDRRALLGDSTVFKGTDDDGR